MKCKEILFNLEMYIAGELQQREKAAVEGHLDTCRSCRFEQAEIKEIIGWVQQGKAFHTKMPVQLERRLAARFRRDAGAKRKSSLWRYAVAASIALAILLTSFFGSTIAQFIEDIPFIRKYFSFGDRGIEHSLSQGAGQLIEESKSDGGVTVTIHRLISDLNQTVVLYSIESPAEADTILFETSVLDSQGRRAPVSGSYSFHEELGKVTGQIRTSGIDELGDKLQVQFSRLRFTKTHTRDVSFPADGAINLTVPLLDGEGVSLGEFILESAGVEGEYLHLAARWEMDGAGADLRLPAPHIAAVYQGGEPLHLEERSESYGHVGYSYRLNRSGAGEFKLTLAYTQSVASAVDPLIFHLNVDKDLAAKSSFEQGIDRWVELEKGISVYFYRVLATPSRTSLEFWFEADVDPESNVGIWEPPPVISLYSDGAKIDYDLRGGEIGSESYFINFDPSIPLEGLRISMEGYLKWLYAPLELSFGVEDRGKTLTTGGYPVTVGKIELDVTLDDHGSGEEGPAGRVVRVELFSPAIMFYNAEITDSAGTRDALDANVRRLENGQWCTAVFFESGDTRWSLVIEPYVLFTAKEMNIFP